MNINIERHARNENDVSATINVFTHNGCSDYNARTLKLWLFKNRTQKKSLNPYITLEIVFFYHEYCENYRILNDIVDWYLQYFRLVVYISVKENLQKAK